MSSKDEKSQQVRSTNKHNQGESANVSEAGEVCLDRDFDTKAQESLQMLTSPQDLAELTFSKAAEEWLRHRTFPVGRARFLSPRSLIDLKQYIKALNRAFGSLKMRGIHAGHIRSYQELRASGKLAPKGSPEHQVGPNKIAQELGAFIRIMKFAHCWTTQIEELYMPLQKEQLDIPRALSPSEQELWLRAASSRVEWQFVYWYSLLGLDCPLSTNEARGLRIGDIDLDNNLLMVRVQTSKNKYRTRSIPMSDQARWAVDMLMARAANAGSTAPSHYLMPMRIRQTWVPERPMCVSGFKRKWFAVRKAINLNWFRPYDLRHTSITRYAEAGTSIAVIQSLAGHISRKMTDHYTHISEQAKKKAVQRVSGNHAFHKLSS